MLAVLQRPGVRLAFLTSCVAQLPMGGLGLLLILHVRDVTGDYAAGGTVAAAYALCLGLTSPVLARVVDRRGAVAVLRLGGAVSAAAILAQALLADGAPLWVRIALAGLAGAAQPPAGSVRRRLWNVLVDGEDDRHRVYALESAVMEGVYLVGPLVLVGAIGSWSVLAGIVCCAAAVLAGDLLFSLHPALGRILPEAAAGADAVDGATAAPTERDLLGALRAPGIAVAAALTLALGVTVGATEVGVPALLEALGARELTGVVLGLWGVGSLLCALVVGRLGAPRHPVRALVGLVAAWGVLHAAGALAPTPLALCLALLVAGCAIAPTFTVLNSLLDRVAPAGTLTEAFTWTSTGMTAGIAVGGTLGGHLADASSPRAALALGLVALVGVPLLLLARDVLADPAPSGAVAPA